MEFALSSNGTNNAYLDRILQTQVDIDLEDLTFCLKQCKISNRAHLMPNLGL